MTTRSFDFEFGEADGICAHRRRVGRRGERGRRRCIGIAQRSTQLPKDDRFALAKGRELEQYLLGERATLSHDDLPCGRSSSIGHGVHRVRRLRLLVALEDLLNGAARSRAYDVELWCDVHDARRHFASVRRVGREIAGHVASASPSGPRALVPWLRRREGHGSLRRAKLPPTARARGGVGACGFPLPCPTRSDRENEGRRPPRSRSRAPKRIACLCRSRPSRSHLAAAAQLPRMARRQLCRSDSDWARWHREWTSSRREMPVALRRGRAFPQST